MIRLNFLNSAAMLCPAMLCLPIAAFSAPAYADALTLTLGNTSLSVAQGGSVNFTGDLSITGTGASDTFLNGDEFASLAPALTWIGSIDYNPSDPTQIVVDDTDFVLSVSFCMNPTGSPVDSPDCNGLAPASIAGMDLFTVTAGADATPGSYLGTFDIIGGGDPSGSEVLAFANFEVDVTAQQSGNVTPEPASWTLLCLGLLGMRSRKHRGRCK